MQRIQVTNQLTDVNSVKFEHMLQKPLLLNTDTHSDLVQLCDTNIILYVQEEIILETYHMTSTTWPVACARPYLELKIVSSTDSRGVAGTVDSESALTSAGIVLSRVPDGGPESRRSPCCGLAL
ncbi:hypothetical protein PoB_006960000 [Plakobranchus ocellatus]|uniref:Uncharacterized protein n=1 Tax=Plakobranchus ocellatus TaxID=259542 RepID=A0AAV4DGE3_9GAST|nr:hypothetical protein PoB_006960000 [Plakobranchus ocellatus]